MPTLEQIANAGPWAVLAFVLISLGTVALVAWSKDAIVTGKRFKDLQLKNRRFEAQVLRNEKTLATMAKQTAFIAERLTQILAILNERKPLSDRDDPRAFHD